MATKTLTSLSDRWTDGTALSVYPRSNFSSASPPVPGQAPVGSAVGSAQTVTNGSVTFAGLGDSTEYVVTDASGTKYVGLRTDPPPSATSSGRPVTGVVPVINPRDTAYGMSEAASAATNGAALQRAIDAAQAAGGVVYVPGVQTQYDIDREITYDPTKPLRIAGDGNLSKLRWSTDLGAGKYAIRPAAGAQDNKIWHRFEGLYLLGPATAGGLNTQPASMSGLKLASYSVADGVRTEGFYAGQIINGDHQKVFRSKSHGNYYGVYYEAGATTWGNQTFFDCNFEGNRRTSIACAPTNSITFSTFIDVHVGFGPYGFERETGTAQSFLTNNNFINVAWESIGNCGIITADRNITNDLVSNNKFTGCSLSWDTANWKIAANAADYAIDVGGMRDNTFDGNIGIVETAGAVAVIRVANNAVGNEIFGVNQLIANVVSSGKPLFDAVGTIENNNLYGRGYRCLIGVATAAIAVNALVQLGGLANQITSATTGVPIGVALHAATSSMRTIYAVQGRVSIKQTTAVAQGNYVKADTVNSGNVTPEATPATKTSLTVGVALGASSGGLVDTRLMQLA